MQLLFQLSKTEKSLLEHAKTTSDALYSFEFESICLNHGCDLKKLPPLTYTLWNGKDEVYRITPVEFRSLMKIN